MTRLPPINDYEKAVLANVEKFGWHCTSVFADKEKCRPTFSYTVGLNQHFKIPEFIIFGLSPEVAHSIFNIIVNAAEANKMYPLDTPNSSLIENYECIFVEVPKEKYNDFVFSALWYNAGDNFPLYQIVWPDKNGKFPWHKSYINQEGYEQPVLGMPNKSLQRTGFKSRFCGSLRSLYRKITI